MAHRNTIAYADRPNLKRRASARANACFDCIGDLSQVYVAGNNFAIRIDYANKRLLQFPL